MKDRKPASKTIHPRDLCVHLEAASPEEIKSGGEGWLIRTGFSESPFGSCLIAESPRGICHLSFVDSGKNTEALKAVQNNWPRAKLVCDDAFAKKLSAQIFDLSGARKQKNSLRCFVQGTKFQVRVWRALLQVRPGTLVSYGDLARSLKNPGASRAVGSAVARNEIAYLIPCHRVIRQTGLIGNYRWGKIRKHALLARESASENP